MSFLYTKIRFNVLNCKKMSFFTIKKYLKNQLQVKWVLNSTKCIKVENCKLNEFFTLQIK